MIKPATIILAAGSSSRMGIPKHQLLFTEGETFLEHIIRVYERISSFPLVVVVNPESGIVEIPGTHIVVNSYPGKGRFQSIKLGLAETKNKAVFIQNVDNPFINVGLLHQLVNQLGKADYAVPVYEGKGGHPVLLSAETAMKILSDYEIHNRFDEVLLNFKREDVAVGDPYIRVNINTKEDYLRYFSKSTG